MKKDKRDYLDIHQPHDSLFKRAFGHQEVAIDFLKSRLKPELLERIQLESLQLENASFVDERLRKRQSDLVLSAEIDNQKGYLYFIIELQMEEDEDMVLRLLEYNIRLMRRHVSQGGKKLPTILNIVLYAGKTTYKGPRTLLEGFENPRLFTQFLSRDLLVDLQREEDEKILKDQKAALAELALKWGHQRDYHQVLDRIKSLGLEASINDSRYAESTVLYWISRTPGKAEAFLEQLSILESDKKQNIMNALQEIEQRGIKLGEQRGIKLGEQRGIKLGEQRGIKLGEQRGIKLGEQRGEQRGIKLGEQRGEQRGKKEGIQLGKREALLELVKKGLITQEVADQMLSQD